VWVAAATQLKGKAQLVKMDSTENQQQTAKYEIRGYPTIKFFRSGRLVGDYEGGRQAADIVSFVEKSSGPSVVAVTSASEFESIRNANAVVVASFAPAGSDVADAFAAAADKLRMNYVFVSAAADVAGDESLAGAVVVYRKADGARERIAAAATDSAAFEQAIRVAAMPLVGEMGPQTYKGYYDLKLPMVYVFLAHGIADAAAGPTDSGDKTAYEAVRTAAAQFVGRICFVWIDASKYSSMAPRVGLSGATFPAVSLDKEGNFYPYAETEPITAAGVRTLVQSFLDGTAVKAVKSEPIPQPETVDGLTTVVGKTFDSLVVSSDRDVFIEFYAPWCGHCKTLAPVWAQLAKTMADEPIRIAKIDATSNDFNKEMFKVEGFPTLFYLKKGATAPLEYGGQRDMDAMLSWAREQLEGQN
jgi:protein disulfide isomerase